jgi:iron complex outermembrane receptor protein
MLAKRNRAALQEAIQSLRKPNEHPAGSGLGLPFPYLDPFFSTSAGAVSTISHHLVERRRPHAATSAKTKRVNPIRCRDPFGWPFFVRWNLAAGLLLFCSLKPKLLCAAEGASAQEKPADVFSLSLEDLKKLSVTGASRREQPTAEAPSSVTIVTAEDVKKYGYRTLADILQGAPGVHVTYDRNYSFVGVRGFNRGDFNSRILILVDGHRINNSLSDGGFIGTEFILDVDLIDKVEIIRGPGSVLYGNNAFFGVINVITRKGRDVGKYGGEVSGEIASFDTYKGRATYGHQFDNGLEVLLSGSYYDSQGPEQLFYKEFNSPQNHNGIVENGDSDTYKSAFGTLTFHDFTLQGGFITREKGNPTALFGTVFNDPRTQTVDERSYITLKYDHDFEVVQVAAQVYYDRYDFDGTLAFPTPTDLVKNLTAGEWWGAETQFRKTFFDRHTLTLGGEYREDFRLDRQNFFESSGIPFADDHRTRQSYGVYLQGEIRVLTNLLFNAGARYDYYESFGDTVNPRLALIYDPFKNEKSVFKAIYGTAFRAPNFFELLFDPNLNPETITTYELVYEQQIGSHFRSSLSGFYNQIDDLISFNQGTFSNVEGAEAKGLELELASSWPGGLQGRISYTLQETEDRSTGQRLTDSPRHLGKVNLSAPVPLLKDKVFASVEFQYTSERLTLAGTEADGFGIVNFTLFSRNLVKGLELSASVYNLLDTSYSDPATPFHTQDLLERDGRTFRVKLTYRF